jgi:hypothetical protein
MGIAGLVLGIIGAILSFIPGGGYFGWLICLVGIILSAIGMSKAKKANQPAGAAIAGLVLSIVGFVLSLGNLLCLIACASAAGAASSWF